MHLLYAGGSFADGRGNTFDAAATDIAHRKDPRQAGLEELGSATRVPQLRIEVLSRHVGARNDERFLVEGDTARQPVVLGTAPVMRKTCLTGKVSVAPLGAVT